MGRYSVKRQYSGFKEPDAVDWLKQHPEDTDMARENLEARKYYSNDGVRQLFAAVSLRACADYNRASKATKSSDTSPEKTIKDCRKFFGGDIFQFFISRMTVEEIEKRLLSMRNISIEALIKQEVH